jgi:hypothetical protein
MNFPNRIILRTCATAVIRVYDESGNVIATHEDAGRFKEP